MCTLINFLSEKKIEQNCNLEEEVKSFQSNKNHPEKKLPLWKHIEREWDGYLKSTMIGPKK